MPVAVCSAPGFPSCTTDVWAAIQAQTMATAIATTTTNPFHGSLSQFSLETCTESLGSETGSEVYFSDLDSFSSSSSSDVSDVGEEEEEEPEKETRHDDDADKLLTVNYHCSISKKSPVRSFPPPLPSISRRDGPCLSMRPHRRDGRLVMEAVQVPSQNYLHAERHNGRLLLSFVHSSPSSSSSSSTTITTTLNQTQQSELAMEEQEAPNIPALEENKICPEQEEEEQEEVEVVDRGTVVELKMSTQPHRSSYVINKFVGGVPESQEPTPSLPPTTCTKISYAYEYDNCYENGQKMRQATENKMLFMSKGRNRGELLHRCSHLWRPLLFWEPYCIATSS